MEEFEALIEIQCLRYQCHHSYSSCHHHGYPPSTLIPKYMISGETGSGVESRGIEGTIPLSNVILIGKG